MSKKLRWGILSTANIGRKSVIPGLQYSQFNEVTAIASRNQAKAEEAAKELNIKNAYGSYEELLASDDIDAVYIPLPNHLHMEWTIKAAEAGKHVLCEKPIALTAEEAERMVIACEQAGVHLAEAFMYRHHPRYQMIKDVIASGEIGTVRGIHANFTFNSGDSTNNIRFNKEMGGGSIYDVGCYPISVARFLTELEPEAVTAQSFFSPKHGDVDMMTSGFLEFPNDVSLIFDCGMWATFRNRLEVLGTDGTIEVPSAFVCGHDSEAGFIVNGKLGKREIEVPVINQYSAMVDHFADVVFERSTPVFTPSDAVRNMRVVESALVSATKRERITL
ncbi:Gfo/Idh/MocA family protein [Paenibacillus provencensis]|uniref:Gfo/Idh/MocA family protein n=1 Tax=Paenibacillus provencensis TaxID=441151 RepID=A0ABW3PIY1_9BACL|nr:Gfo/Idh/MocA family oxidoreductase [Paenibacillus sp. MER 78]MCM3126983.1 Gfo/Idh/MocA family oxidoreductase [Paenibacillus sp. MER 78]